MIPRSVLILRILTVCVGLGSTQISAQWPDVSNTVRLGKGRISEIGLSPDDGFLRITTSAGLWLHDPVTLQPIHLLAEPAQFSLFSADGQRLLIALKDTSIVVYDAPSARVLTRVSTRFTERITAALALLVERGLVCTTNETTDGRSIERVTAA